MQSIKMYSFYGSRGASEYVLALTHVFSIKEYEHIGVSYFTEAELSCSLYSAVWERSHCSWAIPLPLFCGVGAQLLQLSYPAPFILRCGSAVIVYLIFMCDFFFFFSCEQKMNLIIKFYWIKIQYKNKLNCLLYTYFYSGNL